MTLFLLDLAEKARRLAESSYGVAQQSLLTIADDVEREARGLQPPPARSGSARLLET